VVRQLIGNTLAYQRSIQLRGYVTHTVALCSNESLVLNLGINIILLAGPIYGV